MIDFGHIFRRAWDICWQNRWLFLLGILAALGSGGGVSSTFNYSIDSSDMGSEFERQMQEFFRVLIAAWPYLLAAGLALVLFTLVLWLLRLAARGGLIAAAAELDGEAPPATGSGLGFMTALRRGGHFLPRLVGLDLLLYGPIILLVVVPLALLVAAISSVVIAAVNEPGTPLPNAGPWEYLTILGVCLCLVACVAFLWQIVLAFLHPLAQRSIVLDESGVVAGIRNGWRILSRHVGDVLLLVLFLFVISLIFGALTAIILIPLGLLLAVPTILDLVQGGFPSTGEWIAIAVGGLLLALLGQVLRGLYVTYQSVAYTLAYRRLTGKGAVVAAPEPEPLTPYQFEQPTEET